MKGTITLDILSPEKTIFKGEVALVRLPGTKAPFTVLKNHAPLISVLDAGTVRWESEDGNGEITISGGFVQVNDNHVTLCVETL